MSEVFLRKDGLLHGYLPVDAQTFVLDADTAVGLRGVEVVALVLEDGRLAQYGKAVGEAAGDEELAVVLFCQLYGDMLPVGGRAFADVDGYVEDPAADAAYQLALCIGRTLEVQPAHHAVARHALVVLYELYRAYLFVELFLRKGLEKVAPGIPKDAGLYNYYAFYRGLDDFHFLIEILFPCLVYL